MQRLSCFLLFFLAGTGILYSQEQQKEPKYFFKDTTVELPGLSFKFIKILATSNRSKTTLIITNKTENFLIIDPAQIFCSDPGSAKKCIGLSKDRMVVAPKSVEKFIVRFGGDDMRTSAIELDFSKLQMTDHAETIFSIAPLDITRESYRMTGPIKFTIKDKDPEKYGKVEYKITAKLEYLGNKFLGILPLNIHLKTADGADFQNIGWRKQVYTYDNRKLGETMTLIFPLEFDRANPANAPTLYFDDVFGEYTVKAIEGFRVKLRRGTLADYNHKGDPDDDNDND